MSESMRYIIAYRFIHVSRRMFHPTAGIARIFLSFVSIVSPAFLFCLWADLYPKLLNPVRSYLSENPRSVSSVFSSAMVPISLLLLCIATLELFREIAFARDNEMIAVAPISAVGVLGYRTICAALRGLPSVMPVLLFPFFIVWSLVDHTPALVLPLVLIAVYFVWIALLALCFACFISRLSTGCRIASSSIYGVLYLTGITVIVTICSYLIDLGEWSNWAKHNGFESPLFLLFPHYQIAEILNASLEADVYRLLFLSSLFILTTFFTGSVFFRLTLQIRRRPLLSLRLCGDDFNSTTQER